MLHVAVGCGKIEVVNLLISAGAEINAKDDQEKTVINELTPLRFVLTITLSYVFILYHSQSSMLASMMSIMPRSQKP